ncbi:MAG: response regulator [Novosphingobium sp.]
MSADLFNGRSVLVLEDEPIIAMLIEQLLEEAGATVLSTSTLAAAEDEIAHQVPDMAVLDVNIHGQTSYSIAAQLRTLGVPSIFASGYGVAAHPDEFVGVPTVSKPYDLAEVTAAMKRAIGQA